MIGKLTGIIDSLKEDSAIIDVNGVGYVVFCSRSSLSSMGSKGATVSLLIETHVREDQITLFGFAAEEEKIWFLELNKVNGVGPKMALNILSNLSVNNLQVAIASKDTLAFKPVSGVGPKLAERIVTELKNKSVSVATNIVNIGGTEQKSPEGNQILLDATVALEKLGFSKSEAFSAVNRSLSKKTDANLEELIKDGLKELSGT